MIDIRKLKELVRLMVNNDLTELDLRDSEEQVTLRREGPQIIQSSPPLQQHQQHAPAQQGSAAATQAQPAAAGAGSPADSKSAAPGGATDAAVTNANLKPIESPMVGTFYSAPDPDSDAFVKVGSRVDNDTVVCLIEAMKIFNEIRAELSGTIEKIVVDNGESVEFGQTLFLVKPD